MTSQNKLASMDAVGELPDFGNLLLREGGFPHLPSSQSDAWNDASILPTECKVYETKVGKDFILAFQFYDGEKWCFACGSKDHAAQKKYWPETELTTRQWREVQP